MENAISNCWEQLEQMLPDNQKEQIAKLILDRLAVGWGDVVIEFKYHHISMLYKKESFPPAREEEKTSV